MANPTIDWGTKVITVPQSFLTFISGANYTLDTYAFHVALKDLEDDEAGIPFPPTHRHNTSVALGGIVYSRIIELINGYTITFEDGVYSVTLVGSNNNILDVTNLNRVSVRSNNSAGLQDMSVLLTSAYSEEVVVDVSLGQAGTSAPIGTRRVPVNNMADALAIAENIGVNTIRFMRNTTLSSGDYSDGFNFTSDNAVNVTLTLLSGADVTNCQFVNLTLSGALDGSNTIRDCVIAQLTQTNGSLRDCAISGEISVTPNSKVLVLDSFSNAILGSTASFNMNGSGNLELSNFNGEITILNYTGSTAPLHLYMGAGEVTLDASISGGELHIFGSAEVIDNSTGTAIIYNNTLNAAVNDARYALRYVFIDTDAPVNGDGSEGSPFNDAVAAKDFAELKGYKHLVTLSPMTIDRNLKGFVVIGIGNPAINCNGQNIDKSQFVDCRLLGTYTGVIRATNCELANGFWLNGKFYDCALDGNLTCISGSTVLLKNCASSIAGLSRPTISLNAAGVASLSVRGNQGGLTIKDGNNIADVCTVEIMGGSLTFDASNTAATMVARGVGKFVDLATAAGATVIDECQTHRVWQRLDLDTAKPNTYANDGSDIVNSDFTLTKTDNGNGTSTVQRS